MSKWGQALLEWWKWLVGKAPLPGQQAQIVLAGTLGVLAIVGVAAAVALAPSPVKHAAAGRPAARTGTSSVPFTNPVPLPSTTTTTTPSSSTATKPTTTTAPGATPAAKAARPANLASARLASLRSARGVAGHRTLPLATPRHSHLRERQHLRRLRLTS
jgi:hypothetical protein